MSSDTYELVEQLSNRFDITDDMRQELRSRSSPPSNSSQPNQSSAPRVIGVGFTSTVSTFISQKNFSSFVVPQFASHWGVVCDFTPRDRYLFHLVFNVETRNVVFEPVAWKEEWTDKRDIIPVGKTIYDIHTVSEVGTWFHPVDD